jgi:two-component system LytT family response regulator
MKVFIVDDERLARTEMKRLLRAHPEVVVVGEAANAEEALQKVPALAPDLLLLDVEMPAQDGFELLERLDPAPPVVFVTAFDEYAVRAFEISAVDYLLKPVDPERLRAALLRVLRRAPTFGEDAPAATLPATQRVFVREGDRCWFVRLLDVALLESDGNYTRLCFSGNRPLILRSLRYLEARLDPAVFYRASRKHLVNLKAIERMAPAVDGGLDVTLTGGLHVTMSRRQAREFRERMTL